MLKFSTLNNLAAATVLSLSLSVQALAAENFSDFSLIDHTGVFHQISRYADQDAIVLFAHDQGSEVSQDALSDFNKVIKRFDEEKIHFFLLNSSGEIDKAVIAQAALEAGIELAIMMDDTQLVAEELGITRIAEVLVLDPASKEVLYRGALNDKFSEGSTRRRARTHYLREAIEAVLDQQAVDIPSVASSGEAIVFASRAQHIADGGVSYARDVAPILEQRCVTCHQEGGIAPFAMNNHQMVKGWSPMIRETLYTKRMPPGQIDNDYLDNFHGVFHITPEETQTLVHWIDAGSQNNDNIDPLAMLETETVKWIHGTPDIILKIPPQTIPATGIVDYRNLLVPLELDENIWVKAVEFSPGDTQVLHHIIAFSYGPDGVNQFDILNQGLGLGAYAPGNPVNTYPENTGYPLEKDGGLMLQMHYTSSGKETVDASEIGLYLWDEEPRQPILGGSAADLDINIPAYAGNHEMVATKIFREDAYLTMVGPHMHYRGKDAKFTLKYPDGREQVVLNVPNYQFNWQKTYDFKEPLFLPAGTELKFEAAFDNSDMNPHNPDPSLDLTWGEQTWNEMFFGFYRYIDALD